MLESVRDTDGPKDSSRVIVVVPCFNEEATVARVIEDFRRELPESEIVVVDNASTDRTAAIARSAGATVLEERRHGKGFALLTGFLAARDADLFVMVDGDDTYPAEYVHSLIAETSSGADMVIATRLERAEPASFPGVHGFGNRLFVALMRLLFGMRTRDLLSGYRVLTRHFLESCPLLATGFEIEAELSMQALVRGFRVAEVPVVYRSRPKNSASKLRTFADGYRILLAILAFFRDYRPLTFFGGLGALLISLSLAGGAVVFEHYVRTGLVNRLPLAVLSTGLFILGALSLSSGVMLSSINRRAAETAALIAWHARPARPPSSGEVRKKSCG